MEKVNINHSGHTLYAAFKNLYSISFPLFEQRTEEQQEYAFSCSAYHLTVYRENDIFIGFISWWEFQACIYVEHLAISQALRKKGYGNRILKDFISRTPEIVLLEIDPVTDTVSEARLRFYEKCGFYKNNYPHLHPPYREGNQGHPLIVMTTKREVTKREYEQFKEELTRVVMA